MNTKTTQTGVEEYNMPSTEIDGEVWIRQIDHENLISKAKEEGAKYIHTHDWKPTGRALTHMDGEVELDFYCFACNQAITKRFKKIESDI